MSTSGSARWWEDYLFRYLVPTIAGMLIIVVLFQVLPGAPIVTALKFGIDFEEFRTAALTLLFLYGMLFCYIASYPVLVFHVTRAVEANNKFIYSYLSAYALSTLLLCAAFTIAFAKPCAIAALILCLFYSGIQIARIFTVTFSQNSAFEFISHLAKNRAKIYIEDCKNGNQLEQVHETYWQMREHGNSAFILILEIALALLIYIVMSDASLQDDAKKVWFLIAIAGIWVLPAMLVHMLGQKMEKEFSGMESKITPCKKCKDSE